MCVAALNSLCGEDGYILIPSPYLLRTVPRYRIYSKLYGGSDRRLTTSVLFGSHYLIDKGGRIHVGDVIRTKKVWEKKRQ
jgi:hypothetical protein